MTAPSEALCAAMAGRYEIERELGQGGMATVYLARDLKHHRQVAIKVVEPELAASIGSERFLREIATAARLTHPHILPLYDSGEAGGFLYYVMPYVEGESLRDRLVREKQLPLDEALQIAREVADALSYAHSHDVVHRDVKPANILLESGHAVVADFGIARAVAAAGGEKLTATGVVVGTPAYMSPEQTGGSSRLDGRSDQYSLGCVLYEMLAGQPPFTGPTVESLVHQHLSVAPHPVTAVRSSVPLAVERAITKALAKTPADRYATPGEFATALTAEVEPLPAPRTRSGRWWAVPIAAVLVALVAVAVWQAWWPFGGPGGPPPTKKDWILVAEFESAPADTMVAVASHDLLSAALDQSRIVATVPPDQIRRALTMAGKPGNARVDAELARELAYRGSVRAVLEGKVGRLGPAYSLVLRLVDADTTRVILTESAVAKDETALMPVIGNLAKKLRRGLGENRAALRATRPLTVAMTPSFEAYKLYVQAERVHRSQTANRQALALYREAVALDSSFARAWSMMGTSYFNVGLTDSACYCLEQALRYPDRLTAAQRDGIGVRFAVYENDLRRVLAICNRILAENPNDAGALVTSAGALMGMARFEESAERLRRAMKLSPFGPSDVMWLNLGINMRLLRRFHEAREAFSHLGVWKWGNLALTEMAAGRFATADSIVTRNLDDTRANEETPGVARATLARIQYARGSLRASAESFARAVAQSNAAGAGTDARFWEGLAVEAVAVSGRAFPLPAEPQPRDTTPMGVVTRGLWATVGGDRALAQRCANEARSFPARRVADQGSAPLVLRARVALLEGHPQEAIDLLGEPAAAPVELGMPNNGRGLTFARWTLADAFEALGQPDSATAYLERDLVIPFEPDHSSYIHHRLALLYVRLGRLAEAERHLMSAERIWDRPDPEVRRMLDEARTAVRSARGMASSEAQKR